MNHRHITICQATAIQKILEEECGFVVPSFSDFIASVQTELQRPNGICHEYRFCGALGYGGKFYNDGNADNTPHVGCYPEDLTPQRQAMIAAANRRIAQLFNP